MHKIQIRGKTRDFVFARAHFRCEYCTTPVDCAVQPFVTEHIFPTSKGGKNVVENLACSCGGCNGHKHKKFEAFDPADGQIVPLFNPRMDVWADHFSWNSDFLQIIGHTSVGRATVEALKLNRSGLLNIRRLLLLAGEHPPDVF